MEKIRYIKGNQEHAREIENYFVSQGVGIKRHFSYALETFAYFVNPDTGFVDGYSVDSWEFKAFEETGVFEELKYPYDCTITNPEPDGSQAMAKPKLKVIQGVPFRGDEVIALLESLGGKRTTPISGSGSNGYYYINEIQQIDFRIKDSDFFDKYDIEILTLPEGVVKPKLKVIRGCSDRGDVIETLESLGGQNFYKLEGNDNEYLYYIDGDGFIRGLDDADNFFKGYDLEEIMLPEEYVKPKLQVVLGNSYRRDEVIKILESLGGINKRGYDGKSDLCYYFIDPSDPEKAIDYLRRESTFFDKFDLEVLPLPGEEESLKEPETAKFEPFVSKVLVRNNPGYLWMPAFFFSEESEGCARWYHIVGTHDTYRECIPYEGNEELAFTSHDVRSM